MTASQVQSVEEAVENNDDSFLRRQASNEMHLNIFLGAEKNIRISLPPVTCTS